MTDVDAVEEGWHEPTVDPWWAEAWHFEVATADASLGLFVRITRLPVQGRCWYWSALARPGHPTVLVRDDEVPHPRHGRLEVRHEGLWADHSCDAPVEQWSLGLESFGVALDDPADAWRDELGHRLPFGFDAEWAAVGSATSGPAGLDGYALGCVVHAEVIVGTEVIELDGAPGVRSHTWGPTDWWGRADRWAAVAPRLDADAGSAARIGEPHVDDEQLDQDGLPTAARVHLDGEAWFVDPVAHAPLLVADTTGGRVTRMARSLCRWTSLDGAERVGWYERAAPAPRPG